jgi:hypothetical protein
MDLVRKEINALSVLKGAMFVMITYLYVLSVKLAIIWTKLVNNVLNFKSPAKNMMIKPKNAYFVKTVMFQVINHAMNLDKFINSKTN